jgi:hypothetical protein
MQYKKEILQLLKKPCLDYDESPISKYLNHDYKNKTIENTYLIDIKQLYPTIILNAIENDIITTIPNNMDLDDTKKNLRWFLENKMLIKSQSDTLYKIWLSRVNTLYPKLKTKIPPIYTKLLYNDILHHYKNDIILINVDMIILKNNLNIENILKRIYQLYKDAKLDPNHFVSIDNLEWSLINENYQYIYKLNNEIKYNNWIKIQSDKDELLTQVTRELRTLKIDKLL